MALNYVLPFLFSFVFIIVYYSIFRLIIKIKPRFIELIIGASAVSLSAVIFEIYLFDYFGLLLGLLVIAPVLEESLKFVGTLRKRDVRSGIAVGLGFAMIENMLYFQSFLSGYSVSEVLSSAFISSQIFSFIILRGSFDPLLHSTMTGLSVRAWNKEKWFWLPIAMGFHITYNFIAILGMTDISFLVIADIIILAPAVFLLLWKDRKHQEHEEPQPVETMTDTPTIELKKVPDPAHISMPKPSPKKEITIDLKSMELDDMVDYLRKSGKSGFATIIQEAKIDTEEYEKTQWIRRALLIEKGRKIVYTEIGIFGMLLIAGLAAISFVILWVLFL